MNSSSDSRTDETSCSARTDRGRHPAVRHVGAVRSSLLWALPGNLRRLADYPRLSAYLERTLAVPGVRETVNLDHIKRGYYSIKALNPTGIVPTGPELAWAA